MEGKSALFKELGGTDMVSICINVHKPPEMIEVIKRILPVFSAINLEDIKAPECFEVERALIKEYDFPIFHDD
jgi:malate dehydrogenase (oxaloacetate-decarboxylating)